MAIETFPNQATLGEAFEREIYTSNGEAVPFKSLFVDSSHDGCGPANERQILVIFIRHFFCGNCQEYVRRLSSSESPFRPANFSKPCNRPQRLNIPIVLIGPGSPSLIASYAALTACQYPIYADPSTRLYSTLGMHRTLSLGHRQPVYIQHSLLSGGVKSAFQIVRRIGKGDALDGGSFDVNGGEFLFTFRSEDAAKSKSPSRTVGGGSTSRRPSNPKSIWEVSWCHRMQNSRDHTELPDLFNRVSAASHVASGASSRSISPLRSILSNKPQSQGERTSSFSFARSKSRSTSSEDLSSFSHGGPCSGSCPAPVVAKHREEIIHHHEPGQPRSHLRGAGRSHSRSRSRSFSASSTYTASVSTGPRDGDASAPDSTLNRAASLKRTLSAKLRNGLSRSKPQVGRPGTSGSITRLTAEVAVDEEVKLRLVPRVDSGVEFVNVISVQARIEATGLPKGRSLVAAR